MADTFDKRRVSAEAAQKMVAAAKADSLSMAMIAVVDESGLLKAFCRMDDAACLRRPGAAV